MQARATWRSPRALVMVVVCVSCATRVSAQSGAEQTTATVVRLDGEDLFIDVGGSVLSAGQELRVFRSVEVRHPVTHRVLRDRFVLGRLRVVSAGTTLSIARVVGEPWRPVQVADTVELAPPPEPARPAASPQTSPGGTATVAAPGRDCPPPPSGPVPDAATMELLAVFRATLGRIPEERIRLYGIYLQRNPTSPHAPAVAGEIQAMQALLVTLRAPRPEPRAPQEPPADEIETGVLGGQVHRAREGQPVQIALSVAPGLRLSGFLLHVRRPSDADYHTVPMHIDAQRYGRATVPRALVRPASFEYFVEAVGPDGIAVPVVASPAAPYTVTVEPAPGRRAESHRSRIRVSSEFVDFDRFSGRDWYFLTEGDFLYRIRFHQLYGVRVGYGAFRGKGASLRELDDPAFEPRSAGFTYGYVETELQLHRLFAMIARVSVGLGRPAGGPTEQQNGLEGGFQMRIRIGTEDGTHLLLGAETIPEIGQRALIGLRWQTIRHLPMAAEVQVSDQPVSEDLAVRLIYEIGYELNDWLALSARLSYQGRNIHHTGGGAGLAATFDW